MKNSAIFATLLLLLFACVPAAAWNASGHAAVAAMAYRELAADAKLRTALVELLKRHPKFSDWQSEYGSARKNFPADLDLGMFLFIRASTWPDEIRRTKDPALKPFDHPNWHFVDYPLHAPALDAGPSPTPNDDVVFGLRMSMHTLADPHGHVTQRAVALSWVLHLVGDIHQPLHCASLVDSLFKAPDGDQGGNLFRVFETSAKMKARDTLRLHAFWDARLSGTIPPEPRKALSDAKALKAQYARASLKELGAGDSVQAWSYESRDAARDQGYRFKGVMLKQLVPLPAGYSANADRVARRRLALAGYRLSGALKQVAF